MISRKFLSTTLIITIVGSLPLVSGLILLPFYIAGLGEVNFGLLTLYIAITLFFQAIILFATEHKTAVDYYHNQENPDLHKSILSTNLIWGVGFAALLTAVTVLWGSTAGKDVLSRNDLELNPWLWMCVVTAFANAMFKQYTNFLIYSNKIKEFVLVNLVNFIATITISLYGIYHYGDSIQGPMQGRLFSGLIILFLALVYFVRHIGINYHPGEGRMIIRFVWPLLLYFAFSWVSSYIDRFIIKHYLDTESVGIFDFTVKCSMGVEFILAGLVNVVYPKVFELFKQSDSLSPEKLNHSVNLYFKGMTGGVFMAILFTLVAVPLLAPVFIKKAAYIDSLWFLPALCISFLFRIVFHLYYAPIVFFKKTQWLPVNLAVASLLQIGFSIALTAWLGLIGTVISFVLAKFVTSLIFWYSGRKLLPLAFPFQQQVVFPVAASAISMVFYGFGLTSYWYTLLQCAIYGLMFMLFFRKEIAEIKILKQLFLKKS